MQTKYGEFAIIRNKPNKMRQYLQQKTPYLHQQIKSIQKISPHRSLQKDKNRRHLTNREIQSSLAEVINHTRKRINSERSQVQHALNSSLNIKELKNSLRGENKSSNQKNIKNNMIIRTEVECKEGSPRKKEVFSYRYPLAPTSQSQRKNHHQTLNFSGKKKLILPKSNDSRVSEKILNFKPQGRSLYKMSVQMLGEKRYEKQQDSFIEGFVKEQQLGKGGFSVVWSARHLATGNYYAVKEMQAYNQYQTHLAEITFSSFFFDQGKPKPEFQDHPGIDGLLTMYNYHISGQKVYVIYEKCTASLGEFLFDIYEEAQPPKNGQSKGFIIVHKSLYGEMRSCTQFLKRMVYQMAQTLDLLSKCNIVHSDIKTSNILIAMSSDGQKYSFKLIDYGSSFFFQSLHQYRLATPEYIPPELVNFLNHVKGKPHNKELLAYVKDYRNISAVDMWGLGCVLLQIIHGVPLWLNHPAKFKVEGVTNSKSGIFASNKRTYGQILERQLKLIENLDKFLIEENNTKVLLDAKLRNILKGCLQLDPAARMTPGAVIKMLEGDIQ